MTVTITELSAPSMRLRMHEALSIYVQAMGYPDGVQHMRAPMWSEHILRTGWQAIGAFACSSATEVRPETPMLGVAYGYRGTPAYWWDNQVRQGLTLNGLNRGLLSNYFELTELHVRPDEQGRGIGRLLLQTLLDGRIEDRVLLSTPEVPEEQNRAWNLYRNLGFQDVLRDFTFRGDLRPFAVLGRELPLASDPELNI